MGFAFGGSFAWGILYVPPQQNALQNQLPSNIASQREQKEGFWEKASTEPIALFTGVLAVSTIGLWMVTWRKMSATRDAVNFTREEHISTREFNNRESKDAHGIKFLAVETWVRGVLGSIRVGRTEDNIVRDSIQRIGTADPANFQLIAALQMEMLAGDRQIALAQSRRIFFWALVGSGVGLIFFVAGVVNTSEIAVFSGAIVEIVAGIIFVLYGKAIAQLSSFHSRLENLKRYLLANSLCESLDGDERNKARAALIQDITRSYQAVQDTWRQLAQG
jgi:hypothetical protein